MIAYSFHAAGKGAGGRANEGRGKLAPSRPASAAPAYRAQFAPCGEQQLVAHLAAALGRSFPRTFLVAYYVSLKTNPFVVLTGREGAGKAALAAGFAAAVVGPESGQFVTIGSDSWARRGSQSHYYRGIHERFGASQFLETLQEAAAPGNAGKVYLVLLKGLTIEELDLYVNRLLRVGPHGERRLALPGVPPAEQPVVPPNCFITATLHSPRAATPLDQKVLRHAGQIEFSPALHADARVPALPPPPVGFQRTMLTASGHDPRQARARLGAILGKGALKSLGPSPELASALLEGGSTLGRELREDTLAYVANSFDDQGQGLFDPTDPARNARVAYDAQLVQRLLWRVDWRRRADHRRLDEVLMT
ncbi:MAG TPA: hypothetical protein PKD53_06550 [Chloroflexaceae bacterium]|nr:hypothetical protein [Chloroflexaceae bacterium]